MEMGALREDRPRSWRPQLTAQERRVGWAFFTLYLFAFPFLVGGVVRILDERWELSLAPAQSNAVYYTVILLLLMAAFWDFLRHAVTILRDNLRPSAFAFGAGFFAALALTVLVGLIPLPVSNPVLVDYKEQHYLAAGATWAVVALLRPAVEEILYRGLLFGSLRKKNRALAYGVSAGLFALASVWQFAFPFAGPGYLLLAIQYLPMGLVLCWSYDISGSVFVPMALRMTLNALFLCMALAA